MPKIIETTVYEYHELPTETAKAAARQWLSEAATDSEWWDTDYQDALDVGLKITGFDLERRGITIEIETSAPEVAETIIGNHGKECETYKAAHDYLRELDTIGAACDAEDGTPERNTWEAKREEIDGDFLKELRRCYLHMLDSDYEYLTSAEHLAEFAEANEYTFTETGKRFG